MVGVHQHCVFLFFSISISELTRTRAARTLQLVSERRVAAQVHAATFSDLDEVWRAHAGRYMPGGLFLQFLGAVSTIFGLHNLFRHFVTVCKLGRFGPF